MDTIAAYIASQLAVSGGGAQSEFILKGVTLAMQTLSLSCHQGCTEFLVAADYADFTRSWSWRVCSENFTVETPAGSHAVESVTSGLRTVNLMTFAWSRFRALPSHLSNGTLTSHVFHAIHCSMRSISITMADASF